MMNAIKLTLAILCMVTLTYATMEYELHCTSSEVGIRWPSYSSNSQYYVCQREGGKVMTITCKPGEVFTFVLQSCTTYSKYIPAPPMNALPTSSTPIIQTKPENGFGSSFSRPNSLPSNLPKPNYPDNNVKPFNPLELAPPFTNEIPSPPIVNNPPTTGLGSGALNNNNLFSNIFNDITKNNTNNKNENIPPMPATSAPTPPVVISPAEIEKEQQLEITNKLPTSNTDRKPTPTKVNKNGAQTAEDHLHKLADKKTTATNKKANGKNVAAPKKAEKSKSTDEKKTKKGSKTAKPEKTNTNKVAKSSPKGASKAASKATSKAKKPTGSSKAEAKKAAKSS